MFVPWRIAIMMADLPGARHEQFTSEETDILVRAVKDNEVTLYGDGRNPPKLASVKQVWKEIATIVSTAGFPRTSHQCSKPYNDVRRQGKSKLAGNKWICSTTGGGSVSTQDLTPAEDMAASTLTPESVEGFGGLEIGNQPCPTPRMKTLASGAVCKGQLSRVQRNQTHYTPQHHQTGGPPIPAAPANRV
ncbi:hypothetical protein PFLUV_G00184900 [Perca fluviatilis]|uniref:Myb/SANT-like DNA-binding domain-containing protein n=1 Tax=Perca fluviatilis TaxID=8168 RepID=A0A6A5F072_PERFL|nr:hypothetical protein PFLUV_G00184900 [Perca fluviatilis]